jgi:hypothetical protein
VQNARLSSARRGILLSDVVLCNKGRELALGQGIDLTDLVEQATSGLRRHVKLLCDALPTGQLL